VLLDEVPWLSGMIKGIERGPVGIKLWPTLSFTILALGVLG
jgi:hypothetical protein